MHVGNRNKQQTTCRIFIAAAAVAAVAALSPLCAAAAADFSSADSAGAFFTCTTAASDFPTLVTFAASGACFLNFLLKLLISFTKSGLQPRFHFFIHLHCAAHLFFNPG